MWCVEEPALLSGLTNENSEAAPCARAEIKRNKNCHRVCSTHSVNSLHLVSGEVSEPREAHQE